MLACVLQTSGYDADSAAIGAFAASDDCDAIASPASAADADCDKDANCFPCKTYLLDSVGIACLLQTWLRCLF